MLQKSQKCFLVAYVSIAGIALGEGGHELNAGQPGEEAPSQLPLSVTPAKGFSRRSSPTKINWKGQQYEVEEAIEVLMGVVREPEERQGNWNRPAALTAMAMLEGSLRARSCMEELVQRYDTFDFATKHSVITCFITSGDPRGIPLFFRALEEEGDDTLRLSAANGLALWNIRHGVRALLKLFDNNEFVQSLAGTPIVGQNALQAFRSLNLRNAWGFPRRNEWWKAIDGWNDLDEDQKRALYEVENEKEIEAIRKWWAKNEHRFPDWKPGDPLPEIEDAGGQIDGDEK